MVLGGKDTTIIYIYNIKFEFFLFLTIFSLILQCRMAVFGTKSEKLEELKNGKIEVQRQKIGKFSAVRRQKIRKIAGGG